MKDFERVPAEESLTQLILMGRFQTREPTHHHMTTEPTALNVIKACAHTASVTMSSALPPEVLASVMAANNRVLKAAIIEHGGELRISRESIFETVGNPEHIVATADGDDAIKLALVSKKDAENPDPRVLPL